MAYGNPFKDRCTNCKKYHHKSTNPKCTKNNKYDEKEEKKEYKQNHLMENVKLQLKWA